MHKSASTLHYSATDLSNFLSCPHVTALDLQAIAGTIKKPHFDDPGLEVLKKRGLEHEGVVRDGFTERSLTVQEVPAPPWTDGVTDWQAGVDATLAAMRAGVEVVYQGTFYDGTWVGRPDFLLRVDTTSDLGDWSYEVVDAKLSKEAKAGAVLQISLYSDLLGVMQGRAPEHMHLALRSGEEGFETFRVADYAAYYRFVSGALGHGPARRQVVTRVIRSRSRTAISATGSRYAAGSGVTTITCRSWRGSRADTARS